MFSTRLGVQPVGGRSQGWASSKRRAPESAWSPHRARPTLGLVNPITHALVSWSVASLPKGSTRRQRALVTLGGLVPDVDAFGAPIDLFTRTFTQEPTELYHLYHHQMHCLGWAFAASALLGACAERGRRLRTAALAFLTFPLHSVGDLIGAKGPDGDPWPIPYLLPWSSSWQWEVSWQWELNAWPNTVITLLLLGYVAFFAVRHGHSIVELFSRRWDAAVTGALRARFGRSPEAPR